MKLKALEDPKLWRRLAAGFRRPVSVSSRPSKYRCGICRALECEGINVYYSLRRLAFEHLVLEQYGSFPAWFNGDYRSKTHRRGRARFCEAMARKFSKAKT